MKFIKKYLYIILCSILMLCIAISAATREDLALPRFVVQGSGKSATKEISVFDAGDKNYYVFLPSYADMEQVTVTLPSAHTFSIDDVSLSDGMSCGVFSPEQPYTLKVDGKQTGTLWFYQSKNVGTMYIETDSGSMKYIHSDKNSGENASVTLYTSDGKLDYQHEKNTIKGRGNATWEREKRPYSLVLSSDANLLGMGEATNWILLANAYDETNLNNKLILDLAARIGLLWAPESRWVDVYLNGEYNGLYLLTEKVEVHKNRLNIRTDSEGFLCKIDLHERWGTMRSPFLSDAGRTVEIIAPEILTAAEADTVQRLVNQMEQALLSGEDLRNCAIIDLDSWVRRYLIDEISANIDADLASSYFYYSDGTFFAGPVWDYDFALGNSPRNLAPQAFIAKNAQKSDIFLSPYYSTLYANESFYARMKELYATEFRPILQQLLDGEIDNNAAYISASAQMNSLRWRAMFNKLQSREPNAVHTPTGIKEYLSCRIHFLDSAWLEDTDYCTVQFESVPGDKYLSISVKKGRCLETALLDIRSTVWIDAATGKPFDFSQPVTADVILTQQHPETTRDTAEYITFLSIALLLALLAGFLVVDVIHRRKERSCADERE